MFESLIKSILDKIVGEYIQDLNKENLSIGIFSGDVKIENVSLNPKALDLLELPLALVFSKIGKLQMKVPFKNLGSKPVEVFLDGLYIIVKAKPESEWQFKDYKALKAKLANIQEFSEQCIQKIADKQKQTSKDKEEDKGYLQKMTMKIVDNLQITIQNIHVRFEDCINKKFNWGFCLNKLEINTTDKNGMKCFVDRTNENNKDEPTRKLLEVSNAGMYWNSNDSRILSDLPDDEKIKILNGMIMREGEIETKEPVDFLFRITSQVNLTMHRKGDFDNPEIKVNLGLEKIVLHFKQKQVQQIIEQIEFVSKFQRELVLRKKQEKIPQENEVQALTLVFQACLTKMLSQEKDKSTACLDDYEREQFEKSLLLLEIDLLHEHTKRVVIDVMKAFKIKELEKQKQNQKKGIFGRFFGGKSSEVQEGSLVTEEDRNQIDLFISENFQDEVIDAPLIVRPRSYVFFTVQFNLKGASIILSNQIVSEVQSLEFSLDSIQGGVNLSEEGNQIKASLGSMELSMTDEFLANKTTKRISILRPTLINNEKALIELEMTSKLNQGQNMKSSTTLLSSQSLASSQSLPQITEEKVSSFDLTMRSVRFDFNQRLIIRAKQFFDVKVSDQQLKQEAKDKIQETIEEQQVQLQQAIKNQSNSSSILNLNINLESPVFVLPFNSDGSLTNECWVLNLGTLSIITPQQKDEQLANIDSYDLSLSKIRMAYFSSVEFYNRFIVESSSLSQSINNMIFNNSFEMYHTIEEFSIYIYAQVCSDPKSDKPHIQVKGGINEINLKLNPSIYGKLLHIGECFALSKEDLQMMNEQMLEDVELEKKNLLKNSIKSSILYKRSSALKTWEKFHAVLSNGYIYFFQNPKDLKPKDYVWVKNSTITKLDEGLVGFKNAFNVKNKYTDIYLASEKEKISSQWMEVLASIVQPTPINFDDLEREQDVVVVEQKKYDNFDLVQLEAKFNLGKVSLSLFDEQNFRDSPFVIVQINQLNVFFKQQNLKTLAFVGLGGIQLSDFVYIHQDKSLNYLVTSDSDSISNQIGNEDGLIKIDALILEKGHPDYKNIGLQLDLNFNALTINYKPKTVAKVLLFFQPPTQKLIIPEDIKEMKGSMSVSTYDTDSISNTCKNLQENQSILVRANITITEIRLVLVSKINNLPVNDFCISKLRVSLDLKSDEIYLKGNLKNIKVCDFTNFPSAIYLESDWMKIRPQELIGISSKADASDLIEVEVTSFNSGSTKIQSDNLSTFVKAKVNPIQINLELHPILRLVDYITAQLIGSLTNPLKFIDKEIVEELCGQPASIENVQEQVEKEQEEEQIKKSNQNPMKLSKKQISNFIENAPGLLLKVEINNPIIKLKPTPDSLDYLEADLGIIQLSNERERSNSRLFQKNEIKEEQQQDQIPMNEEEKNEIISDKFLVKIQKMQIRVYQKGVVSEMTKKFNANISANIIAFPDQYEYLYSDKWNIDKRSFIESYLSAVILRVSNREFQLLNDCLKKNIGYDDGCDRFFFLDWEENQKAAIIIKKAQKSEEERLKKKREAEGILQQGQEFTGLKFQLDAESLSVFAVENTNNIPFVRVSLDFLRVQLDNQPSRSTTKVQVNSLNGSWFRKTNYNGEYVEAGLLGEMKKKDTSYTLEQLVDLTYLVNHSIFKSESEALFAQKQASYMMNELCPFQFVGEQNRYQINFTMSSETGGDTSMKVDIDDFLIHLELSPILKLAGIAKIENNQNEIPPIYFAEVSESEKLQKEKEMKEVEQFKKQIGGHFDIQIQLQNIVVCTPCADETNILAIKGAVDVSLQSNQAQSIQYIKNLIQKKEVTLNDCYQHNLTSNLSVTIPHLECFICSVDDLQRKKLNNINKRSILLPTTLSLIKQDYLFLSSENACLFSTKTVISSKIDQPTLKIALQDVQMINETIAKIQIQLKQPETQAQVQLSSQQPLLIKEKQSEEIDSFEKQMIEQQSKIVVLAENDEQINQLSVSSDIHGLQIYIVNDLNNAYVPVLGLNLEDLSLQLNQNNISLKIGVRVELKAEYFNPRVSVWEPIVEQAGFQIDYLQNELSNLKQLVTVEMNPNYPVLNLNLSTQLLSVISKTTNSVKKDILLSKERLAESLDSNVKSDSEASVQGERQSNSPFLIKNETGYVVQIHTDLSKLIQIEGQNAQERQQYQLELQNKQISPFQIDVPHPDEIKNHLFKNKSHEQVKVRVLVPGVDMKFIEQIDLGKVGNRSRACKNFSNNKKLFELITEIKLDSESQKKMLTISSPLYFMNDSLNILTISFYQDKKQLQYQLKIKPGEKIAIPIDLLLSQFTINFVDSESPSREISIPKIVLKQEEIKIGDKFAIIQTLVDPENSKKSLIVFSPPYRIKNCLPKTLVVQLLTTSLLQITRNSQTEVISSGEAYEFYGISQKSTCSIKAQLMGHFWSNEAKVSSETAEKLFLKDSCGNQSQISIHQYQNRGCSELALYCKGFLINESSHKLKVKTLDSKRKKEEIRIIGSQKQWGIDEALTSHVVLLSEEYGDLLKLSDEQGGKFSNETNIGGVGNTQVDLLTKDERGENIFQTMGVNVSIKQVDSQQKLFSKVITLSPRFIIVNKTGMPIHLKQKGYDDKISEIPVNARVPLLWHDDSDSKFLNLKLNDEYVDWNWSGNLNVMELGTVNFMCREKMNKMNLLFMRTDVRSDDQNIFIVIEKLKENEIPFLIQNLSKKVKIQLDDYDISLQNAQPNSSSTLPSQQYYFSWDQPFDKTRQLLAHVLPLDGNFTNITLNFSPDQIYHQEKEEIHYLADRNKESSLYIKWSIDIDGFTKIIRFEDSSLEEPVTRKEKEQYRKKFQKEQDFRKKLTQKLQQKSSKRQSQNNQNKEISIPSGQEMSSKPSIADESIEEEKPIIQQQINVCIKSLGLSIIQNNRSGEKPSEIVYVTLKQIEFIQVTTLETQTVQIRIKLMNIDQNNNYTLSNPVILTPQKFALYNKEDSKAFFINVILEKNLLAKNITLFNNLAVELNPFTLRVQDQLIFLILDFIKAINEAKSVTDTQALSNLKEYLEDGSYSSQINSAKNFKWQECEIPPTSLPTFINQLILSNLDIDITFQSKAKAKENNLFFLTSAFTALGVVLADIDAKIKLRGIKLTNCFESIEGIISKLSTHFTDQAMREIFKVFGSLNIIGNPVGLFQNISTGVQDLIQKPVEGFIKGPLEGGFGIMQGASSLIKNTMAGAFNSVNKMAGSLSSGLSALCMDEQYLEQREKMRSKKPKHLVDGAVYGVTSIFSGVANGITGVFLQPLMGAKKSGAKGFIKGIGYGIAGLIVKPVSGVLDAASSAAEGIKNTLTYGDDKANEQRLRYPRVFYGRDGYYKEFDDLDAGMKVTLQLVSKGRFNNSDFMQSILILDPKNKNKNTVLVLTYDVIMLFDQSKQKKQWHFTTDILQKVLFKENGVHLTTSNNIKKVKGKQVFVPIEQVELIQYTVDQINTLCFQLQEEKEIELLDS